MHDGTCIKVLFEPGLSLSYVHSLNGRVLPPVTANCFSVSTQIMYDGTCIKVSFEPELPLSYVHSLNGRVLSALVTANYSSVYGGTGINALLVCEPGLSLPYVHSLNGRVLPPVTANCSSMPTQFVYDGTCIKVLFEPRLSYPCIHSLNGRVLPPVTANYYSMPTQIIYMMTQASMYYLSCHCQCYTIVSGRIVVFAMPYQTAD